MINLSTPLFATCQTCSFSCYTVGRFLEHSQADPHVKQVKATLTKPSEARKSLRIEFRKDTKSSYEKLLSFGRISSLLLYKYNEQTQTLNGVVTYMKEASAQNCLSTMNGSKAAASRNNGEIEFTVQQYERYDGNNLPKPELASYDIEAACNKAAAAVGPDAQIRAIVDNVVLSDKDYADRDQVRQLIWEEMYSRGCPAATVTTFGSSVSGLGLKGCDLDLFIEIDGMTPDLAKSMVNKLARQLRLRRKLEIYGAYAIDAARIPILKFVHRTSGLSCDASFVAGPGVYNSNLIRLYTNYDARVHQFLVMLKLFAKRYELIGRSLEQINAYSFTLIGLFYLSQLEVPIIPSMECLKTLKDKQVVINGWTYFQCNPRSLPFMNPPSYQLTDLLTGFFTFVRDFQFDKNVLSLSKGKAIPIDEFDLADLSRQYAGKKKEMKTKFFMPNECAIYIQDPFELDFNTTNKRRTKFIENLKLYCEQGLEVLQKFGEDKRFKGNIAEIFNLRGRTPPPPPEPTPMKPKKREEWNALNTKRTLFAKLVGAQLTQLLLLDPILRTYALAVKPQVEDSAVDGRSNVLEVAKDIVGEIFTKAFMIEKSTNDGQSENCKIDKDNVLPKGDTLKDLQGEGDHPSKITSGLESLSKEDDLYTHSHKRKTPTESTSNVKGLRLESENGESQNILTCQDSWILRHNFWRGRKNIKRMVEACEKEIFEGNPRILELEGMITERVFKNDIEQNVKPKRSKNAPDNMSSMGTLFKSYLFLEKEHVYIALEPKYISYKEHEAVFGWIKSNLNRILFTHVEESFLEMSKTKLQKSSDNNASDQSSSATCGSA